MAPLAPSRPKPLWGPFLAAPLHHLRGAVQRTVHSGAGILRSLTPSQEPALLRALLERAAERRGGAEVELTSLFADVRGSTLLAEQLGPTGTHTLMDRFYTEGTEILMRSGALIERFLGGQIVGYFVPGYAGAGYARVAIDAAVKLLRTTGNAYGVTPWIPVGIGLSSGNAFVGTVGRADGMVDLTALGEDVMSPSGSPRPRVQAKLSSPNGRTWRPLSSVTRNTGT